MVVITIVVIVVGDCSSWFIPIICSHGFGYGEFVIVIVTSIVIVIVIIIVVVIVVVIAGVIEHMLLLSVIVMSYMAINHNNHRTGIK